MSTRGVIRGGAFSACGDGSSAVPECIGRAVCTCEGSAARSCGCCTCPTFTAAELRFAKEHGLTIEHDRDMPEEWQAGRGLRGPGSWHVDADEWCRFCKTITRVVGNPDASICEDCARSALSIMAAHREHETGRRLVAVPTEAP